MTHRPSRRAFLGARLAVDVAMRPPGASAATFRDRCTQCGDCAKACEQSIIAKDEEGFPVLDFQRECTFCGACARACDAGALLVEQAPQWLWRAAISQQCLSRNGIDCRICQDECEAGAIRFRLQPGGVATPELERSDCTGCGACSAVCPSSAITFEKTEQHEMLETV